jgi:type II secretory pathway pseudopilin PulG
MKSLRPLGGYTIVEVLIVLAVTGGLMVSIMTMISGQQRKTEFTTSARDLENKLQDVFNDVDTGFYNANGQLKCDNPGYTGPAISAATTGIGTNDGCIFLGKAIRFYSAPGGIMRYDVYTIGGKRQKLVATVPVDVTTLVDANPKLFYVNAANSPVDSGLLGGGLNVSSIRYVTNFSPFTAIDSEGLAVLSGISAKDAAGKPIASADSRSYPASVNLSVSSPAFSHSFADFKAAVDAGGSGGITAYPQGLVICLNEGARGRLAAIGVGVRLDDPTSPAAIPVPSGSRLATELFLDDNASRFGCTS